MELFYVGSAAEEQVISAVRPLLDALERAPEPLPSQTAFTPGPGEDLTETMDVAQGKLCMGFTADTERDLRRRHDQQAVPECPGKNEPLLFH